MTIGINLVAVALLVPAVFWAAPRYGAIGAAWVWVMLNVGYLIFMIYFMQRRILKTETWGWYRNGLLGRRERGQNDDDNQSAADQHSSSISIIHDAKLPSDPRAKPSAPG